MKKIKKDEKKLIQCKAKIDLLEDFVKKLETKSSVEKLLTNYRSMLSRERSIEQALSDCIRKTYPPSEK